MTDNGKVNHTQEITGILRCSLAASHVRRGERIKMPTYAVTVSKSVNCPILNCRKYSIDTMLVLYTYMEDRYGGHLF